MMLKKLLVFIIALGTLACSKKPEQQTSKKERIEIAPFKISKVFLRDTQSVKTIYLLTDSGQMSITDYNENWGRDYKFLDAASFSALKRSVWSLIQNPGTRVFIDPMGRPTTFKELRGRVILCDMIPETYFDAEGNEKIESRLNCDSVSTVGRINQIRFFESWYFNTETNMIERDILGYSIHQFVPDKNAYRELFSVFVNDAALEKAHKYYFNKQAQ